MAELKKVRRLPALASVPRLLFDRELVLSLTVFFSVGECSGMSAAARPGTDSRPGGPAALESS